MQCLRSAGALQRADAPVLEWQGEWIIGSPSVLQMWKLPGDLCNLVDGSYIKVSQVTKGQTTFHSVNYKEILHTSWGGWSPHAFRTLLQRRTVRAALGLMGERRRIRASSI